MYNEFGERRKRGERKSKRERGELKGARVFCRVIVSSFYC